MGMHGERPQVRLAWARRPTGALRALRRAINATYGILACEAAGS